MKPRKPMGRVWRGNFLIPDEMLSRYGLKALRELHTWLGKVIAWGETQPKKRKIRTREVVE